MNEEERRDSGLTGVVLAGGYSRRFGDADKTLARVGGESLLHRVVTRLGDLTDGVVVNCRTDQRQAFETELAATPIPVRFAEDPATGRGPLFGFWVALQQVNTGRCILTTCDTPFLDTRVLSDLVGRLGTRTEAVAIRTSEAGIQPVQAVYQTEPTERVCNELLDSDERRLSALFDRLNVHPVPAGEVAGNVHRSLFDVDTPEDHEQAINMLRESKTEEETEVSVPP